MPSPVAPLIFSAARRIAARRRMLLRQTRVDAPRYLVDDMIEDALERIAFVRLVPRRALVIGDYPGALAAALAVQAVDVTRADPADEFDEEQPLAQGDFDLIVSLGTLDTVNDLPGALIHLRQALAPGGLMLAGLCGAGSLPQLRAAMLAGDGERAAPRIHPQIDARAGAQLLQRAGFADPVADARALDVRFGSLAALVADLRAQALSNVLARPGPPLGKAALARTSAAFAAAGSDGRVTERFEILTLTGWRR